MTTVQQRQRRHKLVIEPKQARNSTTMRAARLRSGLSLREVATRMSISPPYLSDLERGRRAWPEARVAAFKRALRGTPTRKRKASL